MEAEQITALKTLGLTKNQMFAVIESARQINSVEERIVDQAKRVTDRVARSVEWMAKGHSLNELGELQQQGSEFDRLVAVRAERTNALKLLLFSLEDGMAEKVEAILG